MIGSNRIKAIVGHYGSGKTEVAMNLAVKLAQTQKVTLVDLDIVNPYFRSAEHIGTMEANGVRVVKPDFAATSVDIPSLSAGIDAAILDESSTVILDVGGDDEGARALGRFKPYFDRFGLDLFAVVNPYRPRSGDEKQIIGMIQAIQVRARFPVIGLINNANLAHMTTAENLLHGREILQGAARQLGVPIVMECALSGVAGNLPPLENGTFLELTRYTKPEWMD